MPNETTTQESSAPKNPEVIPMEQYKNIQRQLNLSRSREKEAVVQRFDVNEVKAEVQAIGEMVKVLVEKSGLVDADDAGPRLKTIDSNKQSLQKNIVAQRDLSELLVDAGVEWSDPQLEEVKSLYDAKQYDAALQMAKKKLGAAGKGEVEALVEAEVQKVLKSRGKINTGDTVSPAGLPGDPEQIRAKLHDSAWFRAHRKEVLAEYKAGKVR